MFRLVGPQAQDWLTSQLRSALTPLPVFCGYPVGGIADKEKVVWVEGALQADLPRRTSGMLSRDEDGTIEVRVSVTRTSAVWTEVRDAALALAGAVEDLVQGDPTLGGLVMVAQVSQSRIGEAHPDERRIQAGVTLTVTYQTSVAA